MKKTPTLFVRDPGDLRHVTREVHPDCAWVVAGEGVPTRKYDGTCVRLADDGSWYARREVKPGKATPVDFVPVETDPVTGKTVGWEPIERSAFARFHAEALSGAHAPGTTAPGTTAPGTYELCGPKVNGNPEGYPEHRLVQHERAEVLADAPRDYDGLVAYFTGFVGEGIVWHHPDGRMAKLKRRDFSR